jgi:8-oxo-dGTP diphosphatase
MWALPGGFMDMDETTEQTAHRELEEETSLKGVKLKQLHTFDTIGRDPRGRTITVMYYGITTLANSTVQGGDDAEDAKWFNINKLPEIAFDHNEPIELAVEKLSLNVIKQD